VSSEAGSVPVVIASPLEPELVDRIRAVDARLDVMYDPDLLATPRYAGDHLGVFPQLSEEQDARWHAMLARAQVSFDLDRREPDLGRVNFPALQWIQASSAGVGQVLPRFDLDLDQVVVTTAAGVHAEPLSEFVVASLFYFVKEFPLLRRWQAERTWTRYTTDLLAGKRVLIVGLGQVGRRSATKLNALGVDVVGAVRRGGNREVDGVSHVVEIDAVDTVLPSVDAVVLACPLTAETEGLIGRSSFAAMRHGTVLVNISRGQVVDEPALIEALRSGVVGGAALDVMTVEPLPAESPLWGMESVLVSPHSASTVAVENRLIVDLFCDNLRRWLDGRPLLNVYDKARGY
jgi:glyoxylate/hydroxypyruvate reductase A